MTDDYDYLLRVVAPDLDANQRFLDEKLTGVHAAISDTFSRNRFEEFGRWHHSQIATGHSHSN